MAVQCDEKTWGLKKFITNNFAYFMFHWLQYKACTYDIPAFVVFQVARDAVKLHFCLFYLYLKYFK